MHRLLLSICLILSLNTFSQTNGFEFLASSKTSLESIIKLYASSIPDTTETYKKYYLPLGFNYNKAKASYDGYRGAMKDCILNNKNQKQIQECLKTKMVDIKSQLDTLSAILNAAYIEAYSKQILKSSDPTYSGQNSGLITGDFIKGLLDTLITGTIKIWDQIKKYRKDYKDTYLTQISNKEYDLAEFDQLLKGSNKETVTK